MTFHAACVCACLSRLEAHEVLIPEYRCHKFAVNILESHSHEECHYIRVICEGYLYFISGGFDRSGYTGLLERVKSRVVCMLEKLDPDPVVVSPVVNVLDR